MYTLTDQPHWPAHVRWLAPAQRWRQPPPVALCGWLDETGSLTTRLQRLSGGRLRVRVLAEGWQRPSCEERHALQLSSREYAWVREVVLIVNDTPWVQARSILPRASLTGLGRRLTRLGNHSLGGLLFRDPALRRGEIATSLLQLGPHTVWGRRSVLYLHGRPILVAEAFLPALWAADSTQSG